MMSRFTVTRLVNLIKILQDGDSWLLISHLILAVITVNELVWRIQINHSQSTRRHHPWNQVGSAAGQRRTLPRPCAMCQEAVHSPGWTAVARTAPAGKQAFIHRWMYIASTTSLQKFWKIQQWNLLVSRGTDNVSHLKVINSAVSLSRGDLSGCLYLIDLIKHRCVMGQKQGICV